MKIKAEVTKLLTKLLCTAASVMGLVESFVAPHFTYEVVCHGPDGKEKWRETIHNLVTTVGKTDIIDKYFKGSAYTAAFYCGLKGSGAAAVGDTMASHAGWVEITAYSQSPRPSLVPGTTSAGSNTAGGVVFSMTGSYTVAGLFITTNSTISGTTGTLYSAGDLAVARSGGSGDTLTITPTVSAS